MVSNTVPVVLVSFGAFHGSKVQLCWHWLPQHWLPSLWHETQTVSWRRFRAGERWKGWEIFPPGTQQWTGGFSEDWIFFVFFYIVETIVANHTSKSHTSTFARCAN